MCFFIRCFYILIFLVVSFSATAQDLINIKHYSTADGLSDNKIVSIIKDRDGYMWFSTWAGINRFDGYNFKKFKSYPGDQSSLKNNRIDYMLEDKLGGFLWVRGYDNQIYRFNKLTQKFTALSDLINDDKLKKVLFKKILAVVNNEVWLESVNDGLFLIEDALGKYPKYKKYSVNQDSKHALPSNKIVFFHLDDLNNAWIGTSMGVSILQPNANCDHYAKTIKILDTKGFTGIVETEKLTYLANGSTIITITKDLKKINSRKITEGEITNFRISKISDKIFCSTSRGEIFSLKENEAMLLGVIKDHSPLYSMVEASDGNLWVESENYGVASLDAKTGIIVGLLPYKKYNFKPWLRNFSMFENNNKTIWIALNGYGLGFYDKKSQKIQSIAIKNADGGKKLSNLLVKSFYDPDGVLWLVSDYGGIEKVVFQDRTFSQKYVKPESNLKFDSEVRGVFADEKKRLWVGTRSGGLHLYKDGEQVENPFVDQYNFNSGIYSIFKDRTGCMWFGTKWDGLFKAIPEKGLNSDKFKITNHFFETEVLKSAPAENSIYSIIEDSKGRIWAGSYGGGIILVKDEKGDIVLRTIENSFRNYPEGNFKKVRYLAEDSGGKIWIATTDGLVIFNPNDVGSSKTHKKFKVYRKQNGDIKSLGGNDVQFIYKDSKNRMWVLTSSGGLNLAIGENPLDSLSFQNFSSKDGLPSDFLLSCIEDSKQNLWLTTQNGITKFSTINHKIQNFSHYDGLNEDATFSESSCTKMLDGSLAFGNTSGFLVFNPLGIYSKKIGANMAITNILINGEDIINPEKDIVNKEATYLDNLNLNYDQNIISIDFAVLDFYSNDKQSYACRILGFDNVWRSTEHQTKITYTNLPPGDYTFQVKSLDDEFYKTVPFRSLKIKINPPLWRTWWAYTLYILLAIAILILIQRVIYTMLKLRNGIEVEKKLAELKLNFFTQISHELRTPLTLIVNPMEELLNNENLSAKGRSYAKLILKNSKRMTRLVNQVLDLRKVQSGKASLSLQDMELKSFIHNLINYFQATIAQKNLNVKVLCKHDTFNTFWDLEKIEIVIYNLLSNAIKFSPDGGNVHIVIDDAIDEKWCKIEIIDEGQGVLDTELQNIFNIYYVGENKADGMVKSSGIGLALAKELVELHYGEIYAENISPSGFKVVIKLKKHIELEGRMSDIHQNETLPMYHQEQDVYEAISPLDADLSDDVEQAKSTVLIVEDNEDLRNFLAIKFKELYHVETAVDGEEGVRMAIELMPDLILSDIMMPKMDGMQLLNKLKNNSLTSHIPIILLTAKNSVDNHIKSLKYGADYYLSKPFDMNLLSVTISNILVRRHKYFKSILENKPETTLNNDAVENIVITIEDKLFLEKTIKIVNENLKNYDFNIDIAADLMNMSRSGFFKKFKSLTNIAPVEFVRDTRLEQGKLLLEEGSKNVSEVAYAVGFKDPKYFSTCFKNRYKVNPTEYVKKN